MFNETIWFKVLKAVYAVSNGSLNAKVAIDQVFSALPGESQEDINDVLLYMYEKGTINGPQPAEYLGRRAVQAFAISATLVDLAKQSEIGEREFEMNRLLKNHKYQRQEIDDNAELSDVIVISIDLRSSTKFKQEFPHIGSWTVIVEQLKRIKAWLLSFKDDLKYLNFTGDGYIAIIRFSEENIEAMKRTRESQSLRDLISDLLSIRKKLLTKTTTERPAFEGESYYSLTSPRFSIHKSIDSVLSVSGDCIGPDIDFAARLNNPKIEGKPQTEEILNFFTGPGAHRTFYSPVFVSDEIERYFGEAITLGKMEAKGISYSNRMVHLLDLSGSY